MIKLLTVDQIINNELNRLGVVMDMATHPKAVADQAIGWDEVSGYKVPMIGGLTELESLLFKWIDRRKQILATKIHLAQLHLADTMIKDLDIPETDTQLAIATCLNWVAGKHGGEYRFLQWMVNNSDRVEEIVELGSSWEWESLRWYRGALFMGTRVDPKEDWTSLFLSQKNLLADVESLIDEECGSRSREPQEIEDLAEELADEGLGKP